MLKYPFGLTFCVGAPRSGTTVVGSLLTEGPAAFPMLPECTYVTQIIRLYHEILHHSDPQRFTAFAKSDKILAHSLSSSIDSLIKTAHSHFAELPGSELILKDPELTIYLDHLPLFFEKCKIVCVVRDPLHVIASMYKVFTKQGKSTTVDELTTMIFNYYWRASESEAAKSGAMHFIDFEKIVQGDESEFAAIEQYLGYQIGRHGFGKTFFDFDKTDATHSPNYGQPIRRPPALETGLTDDEDARIRTAFSGYNLKYRWWS